MTAQRSPAPKREFDLGDYVQVKDRIAKFYELYGNGRLVTTEVRLTREPDDKPRVLVEAKAYRSPDDPLPGVGWSWLELPGKSPYTNGSEVENAETSAWGRAIASLGVLNEHSIASAQEIANKQAEPAKVSPIRSKTEVPEPDEGAIAELYAAQTKEKEPEEAWDYARFRLAMAELPTPLRPDKPKLIRVADRLFPAKDLPLAEPKAWALGDREWRQLAEMLAVPE